MDNLRAITEHLDRIERKLDQILGLPAQQASGGPFSAEDQSFTYDPDHVWARGRTNE